MIRSIDLPRMTAGLKFLGNQEPGSKQTYPDHYYIYTEASTHSSTIRRTVSGKPAPATGEVGDVREHSGPGLETAGVRRVLLAESHQPVAPAAPRPTSPAVPAVRTRGSCHRTIS